MFAAKIASRKVDRVSGEFSERFMELGQVLNNFTVKLMSKLKVLLEKIKEEMGERPGKYIFFVLTCVVIMIYFIVFFRRIPRFLNRMDHPFRKIAPKSIAYNLNVKNRDYHLADFWIASSYKSYLPCTNYLDVSSTKSIEKILKYGCRCIDLDVMNETLAPCTHPVVCNGIETGTWHLTTRLSFDKVIEFIAKFAFSSEVPNGFDPLFLNINFKTWYNKQTVDKCADIIKKHFSSRLLGDIYNYKVYNPGQLHITKLLEGGGKVVIMTNSDISHTKMEDITNIGYRNMVTYGHTKFLRLHGLGEIKKKTGHSLMRVIPDFKSRMKKNFNFLSAHTNGVQFIAMNYTEPDKWMQIYSNMFKDYSMVLKPEYLRGKDDIVTVTPQTEEIRMLDKEEKLNFWEILY